MPSTFVLTEKKRKRYAPAGKDISSKLTGKLHHGFKEVRKSVKKAKMFETQKLVKKLKHLRKTTQSADGVIEEINELETQLESLKRIDQERIAQFALSSKIRKDKILSSNEALTLALASVAPISTSLEAHAKVESRLLSSKFLAGEVNGVLSGLRAVLEPKLKIEPASDLNEPTEADEAEGADNQGEGESSDDSQEESAIERTTVHTRDENISGGLDDVVDEVDDLVDDDGWESGSVRVDDGENYDDDDSPSSEPPRKRLKQVPARPQMASSEQDAPDDISAFLPSLSVGFIKGDSESDFDEMDDEVTNAGKKNRRGQRARQAIWEKKYGKNAKHVQKRREEVKAVSTAKMLGKRLDSGWHRGPSLSDNSRSHIQHEKTPKFSQSGPDRPTHPSWEAKKKLKEKEGAKILTPQGKKIVFT